VSARAAVLLIALLAPEAACAKSSNSPPLTARSPTPLGGAAPAVGILEGADVSPILRDRAPINLVRVLELAGETPNLVRFAKEKVAESEAELHRRQAEVVLPTVRLVNEFEVHQGEIQFQLSNSFATTGRRDFLGLRVFKDWNLYGNYEELAARALDRDAEREKLGSVKLTSLQDGAEGYFDQAVLGIHLLDDALHGHGRRIGTVGIG